MITNTFYLLDQVIRGLLELRKQLIISTTMLKKVKFYEFKSALTKHTEKTHGIMYLLNQFIISSAAKKNKNYYYLLIEI